MAFNPWHDISAGEQAPAVVNAVMEIPRGSRAKYELDKDSGLLRLDRVLYSSVDYPANYGFIPNTYCDDKDPLDILVISQVNIVPMCLVSAKVIGVMRMIDGGEADDKIIAVAADDVSVNYIHDINSLPPYFSNEIKHFFEEYKRLERKTVEVIEFRDSGTAKEIIRQAMADYAGKYAFS